MPEQPHIFESGVYTDAQGNQQYGVNPADVAAYEAAQAAAASDTGAGTGSAGGGTNTGGGTTVASSSGTLYFYK